MEDELINPENSQQALAQLQGIQQSSQDPNAILSGQRQQLGVDKAQETVTGLRGAINNTTKLLKQVAPSVMGRTGSSLVTNAQATRQIGNEQAPISANLTEQGTQLSDADRTVSELNSKAQEAASGIYTGQQDKLSYAQNLYNTLYQKEQAAQAAQQAEANRQEQIRQFNEQLKQSQAATAAANRQFDLGGGSSSTSTPAASSTNSLTIKNLSGGKSLTDASSSLKSLLATKNATTIRNTLSAIQASARNGNSYDKAKLQLINTQPEFSQYLANFNGASF